MKGFYVRAIRESPLQVGKRTAWLGLYGLAAHYVRGSPTPSGGDPDIGRHAPYFCFAAIAATA